jgi:hypothetical protein
MSNIFTEAGIGSGDLVRLRGSVGGNPTVLEGLYDPDRFSVFTDSIGSLKVSDEEGGWFTLVVHTAPVTG